jgi:hypothetical protein
MSYNNEVVWTIIPEESFKVIRNCSKCDCKSKYSNTGNFRVNANGNYLDVWLIYQCDKCKNTYNLGIYERVNPRRISFELYQKFLANDKETAFVYGTNREFFKSNKAEIDQDEVTYQVEENVVVNEDKQIEDQTIIIKNPYSLKIRLDKVISKQLDLSRTQVKKRLESNMIYNNRDSDLKKAYIYDDMKVILKTLEN